MFIPTVNQKQSLWSLLIISIIILAVVTSNIIVYNDDSPAFSSSRYKSSSTHGLRAIVTGLEHSCTTLVVRLLYNAPCVIGALETGFLLADQPNQIEAVQPWFKLNSASWTPGLNYRLTPVDVEAMKNATNFLDMYQILRQRSYLFNDLNDETYCEKPYEMIDKTPRYIYKLHFEKILEKTPNVPVIVTQKGYDKLKESWMKRNGNLTQQFYEETFDNVELMKKKFTNRILIVQEEDLMQSPKRVMLEVFHHVGLEWKDEYLQMVGLLKKVSNDTALVKRIKEWRFEAGKHSPDRKDAKQLNNTKQ